MSAEITIALIGGAGVLVGAASSTTVALVIAAQNRRLQERLAVANEVYRQASVMRDERREAYAHFLAALDAFNRMVMAAALAARDDELEDGSPSPGGKLRDATQELWFRFLALVLVSGADVRDAASRATDQMRTSSEAAVRGEVRMIEQVGLIEVMRAELGF